jgi:uncharacterized membrane protein YraQ (UPF0718 family)
MDQMNQQSKPGNGPQGRPVPKGPWWKRLLQRYMVFIVLLIFNLLLLVVSPAIGKQSFVLTYKNVLEMLSVIPPIFVLLGLLDVYVKRETMIKLMGDNSGLIGIVLAFVMGSVAAGPLYAAFPVAAILLKKGSRFSNVLIFIGAWSTTKIPLLLFEATSMGWQFMLIRFALDIPGIALIAFITEKMLTKNDKEMIRKIAESVA